MKRWVALLLAIVVTTSVHGQPRPRGEMSVSAITQSFSRNGMTSSNHSLTVFFHSFTAAPPNAVATLDVPPGLGVGGPVSIQLTNVEKAGASDRDIIAYWGSSDRILPGQPRVRSSRNEDNPRYTDGATGMADPVRLASIAADGHAEGVYIAHVSFLGESSVQLTDVQNFLDPVIIGAPVNGKVDFAHPITLSWNRIPRAAGYRVTASARAGDGRIILWENAWRSDAWRSRGVTYALRSHLLMPIDQTSATIPPGIFMGGPVLVRVSAISPQASGKGPLRITAQAQSITTLELTGR